VRDAAARAPLDRILVETDCPFLAPVPHRGKRNEPAYVALTAAELARLRGLPADELARATTENARRSLRLPHPRIYGSVRTSNLERRETMIPHEEPDRRFVPRIAAFVRC